MNRDESNTDFIENKTNVCNSLLDTSFGYSSSSKSSNIKLEDYGTKNSKADENGVEEETNYWPNCDTSVWMRSCDQEVIEPIKGETIGVVPEWLSGTLLRNGPGSLKVGEYSFDHLFDSSALLHRFEISDGCITYQRRFVQTDVYKNNQAAKRILLTEFGTKAVPDPCQSIFQRVSSIFNPTESMSDNSMISVYPFGDEYYTFAEAPFIHRIDPKTLETKCRVKVSEYVGILHHTSHPHVMSDGTVYNLGMSLTASGPAYSIICFPPSRVTIDEAGEEKELSMFDQATIVATVPSRWILNPSYMHTFGITENYYLIVEQPLSVALGTMVGCRIKNEPMCHCLKWFEDENTHIHVISRETGQLEKTFVAETFFYLHIINQFETRDRDYIVIDICCYRDAKMLDCMYVDVMKNMHKNPNYSKMFRGRPLRFILPMKTLPEDTAIDQNLIANTVNQTQEAFQQTKSPVESTLNFRSDLKEAVELDASGTEALKEDKKNKRRNAIDWKASAYRLPGGSIFVRPELLCDLGCETPRINYESFLGREYRYFYAISSDVDLENPGTIIKVDVITKTRMTWCEANVYPSEPIFVPDPNGKKEDDGVVISSLVWGRDRETEVGLIVLDAVTFKELARATFDTPGPVPKCLHGWFSLRK